MKFDVDLFSIPGVSENQGVPSTRRDALTAVLQYHADCDLKDPYFFKSSLISRMFLLAPNVVPLCIVPSDISTS